ncbi:hypothetical protein GCM10009525_82300 [Streptosporangium amethystogenes subsp. fukuiense]
MTPPQSGRTPGSTNPLSRLVRACRDEAGLSLREFADKCIDPQSDRGLLHNWIGELEHGRLPRAPEMWRLRALAAGMGVPVQQLAELSAKQWLGVDVAEIVTGERSWVAVTVPEGLTPEERARFVRLAEDLARHMKE